MRSWNRARAVFAFAASVIGLTSCGAPAPPPKGQQPEPAAERRKDKLPKSQAKPPACVAEAAEALPAAKRLLEAGNLDAGYQAVEQRWQACPAAQRTLYAARLESLRELDYLSEAKALAAQVLADPEASADAQTRARSLLSITAPAQDELVRAQQLVADAQSATAKNQAAQAQHSWDRALHAFLRATGAPPRPAALVRSGELARATKDELLVPIREIPANVWRVASLTLSGGTPSPHATPVRLLGGAASAPDIEQGPSAAFALRFEDRTQYFSDTHARPVEFPAAPAIKLGRGDSIVLAQPHGVELRRAARPEKVEAKLPIALGDRGRLIESLDAGRFVTLCQGTDGEDSVFALDTEHARVTVSVPDALACQLDKLGSRMLLLRTEATPTRARLWLELHPLDGSAATKVLVPNTRSIEEPTLSINSDLRTVSVGVGRGKARTTFNFGLANGKPARPGVDHDPLREIPVGSADSVADLSALRSLSRPPRRLIKPYFVKPGAWTNNGVRSFDKRTVAVFDGDADETSIELILADTKPLRARHRIPLQLGSNWLTAFFVSNRVLAVQSYPALMFIDVQSGSVIGDGDMTDGQDARMLEPDLLALGSTLWDLSATGKDYEVDLGLGPWINWKHDGDIYLTEIGEPPEKFSLAPASVAVPAAGAPSWLYCAFGDTLADWRVCAGRFTKR